ncbi:MAG: nitrilase-related carbon-nitrogen hydrolase [Candidatus Aphodosoma sp.]
MNITLVQQEIHWGDKDANLRRFDDVLRNLYGKTDLVLLPEMFSTGFCVDKPELAENTDGEAVRCVKRWAEEGGFAVASSFMASDSGRSYNRGFFCCPDGEISFADKRHLFIGDERKFFTPGNRHLDVMFRGVKFRLLICFDLRFPVWSRNTTGFDYDVLLYTANWPKDRIEAWDILTVARAMENQSYVCAVNAIGTDSYSVQHNGHSVALDPRGKLLASFGEWEAGTRSFDIDMAYLDKVRHRLPFWQSADRFTVSL